MPCKRWKQHKKFECSVSKTKLNNQPSRDASCARCAAKESTSSLTSGCSCTNKQHDEDSDQPCPMQSRGQPAGTPGKSKCPRLKNFDEVTRVEMPQCQAMLRNLANDATSLCANPTCPVTIPQPPYAQFSQGQSNPYGNEQGTATAPPCATFHSQTNHPFSIDDWTSQPPPCCPLPQYQSGPYNTEQWISQLPPYADFSQNQDVPFAMDQWSNQIPPPPPPPPCCKSVSTSKSIPQVNEQWTTPPHPFSLPQSTQRCEKSWKPPPMLTQTSPKTSQPAECTGEVCKSKKQKPCCSVEKCAKDMERWKHHKQFECPSSKEIDTQNLSTCGWSPNCCVEETQTPFLISSSTPKKSVTCVAIENLNKSSGPCKEPSCIANKPPQNTPGPYKEPTRIIKQPPQNPIGPCKSPPCIADQPPQNPTGPCKVPSCIANQPQLNLTGPCKMPSCIANQPPQNPTGPCKMPSCIANKPPQNPTGPCKMPSCISNKPPQKPPGPYKEPTCLFNQPLQNPTDPCEVPSCISNRPSTQVSSVCSSSPPPCLKPLSPGTSAKSNSKQQSKCSICNVDPPPCQNLQPCIAASASLLASCSKEDRKKWKEEKKRLKELEKKIKKEEKKALKNVKDKNNVALPGTCSDPMCAAKTKCQCRFPPAFSNYYGCTAQLSGCCQCECMNKK